MREVIFCGSPPADFFEIKALGAFFFLLLQKEKSR